MVARISASTNRAVARTAVMVKGRLEINCILTEQIGLLLNWAEGC